MSPSELEDFAATEEEFLLLPLLLHFNLHLSDLRRMPVVTFGFSAAARDESGKGFVAGAGQASNSIENQITKLYVM